MQSAADKMSKYAAMIKLIQEFGCITLYFPLKRLERCGFFMYRDLFMTSQQQKKIQFLKQMEKCPAGEYSVHTLSQKFHSSYLPFLQMLQELDESLEKINETPLLIEPAKIYWKRDSGRSNTFLIDQVKNSIPYRFLLTSLFYPEKKLKDFSKETFLSESTILRRMHPLIDYLEQCNVRINFSRMELTGQEAVIRLVYIKTLWAASLGKDLMFSPQNFNSEDALLENLTGLLPIHLHPKLARLMLGVCRLRNDQKNYLAEAPFEGLLFSQTKPIFEHYLAELLDSRIQIQRNIEFLNYLFYYYPYCVKQDAESINPMMLYYSRNVEERDPLCLAIDTFYRYCSNELLKQTLSEQEEKILLDNIARTFLNYSIQKKEIPLLFDPGSKEDFLQSELYSQLYPAIRKMIRKLSRRKQLEWLATVDSSISKTLCLNLLPLFIATNEKVCVGLVAIPNYLYLQQVVRFLLNFSFVEIVFQPKANEPVDLYITTFKDLLPTDTEDCYLINILNANYKEDLLQRLLTIKNKKKFA